MNFTVFWWIWNKFITYALRQISGLKNSRFGQFYFSGALPRCHFKGNWHGYLFTVAFILISCLLVSLYKVEVHIQVLPHLLSARTQKLSYKFITATVILLGLVSSETGCWQLSWARTHGVPLPSREGCSPSLHTPWMSISWPPCNSDWP